MFPQELLVNRHSSQEVHKSVLKSILTEIYIFIGINIDTSQNFVSRP